MTAPAPTHDTHRAALAFHDAGCCVLRAKTDGSKAPVGNWRDYQQQRPDRDDVDGWFNGGYPGIGVLTGAVSGNLEMLELEGRAVADGMLSQLGEIALASGMADLWRRVTVGGYMERTPSGGVHLLYRVLGPIGGNTKLARRPGPADPTTGKPTVEVLAETRGEGGFVVIAPSNGPVHPTRSPWERACGDATTIPDITPEEHRALHALARTLDAMPVAAPAPAPRALGIDQPDSTLPAGGTSPGDDLNAKADWADLLVTDGWTLLWTRGRERGWRRPGKTDPGISATTGYGTRDGDWLYVFTTSTELPTEQALTKFAYIAITQHGGDYSAAARALRTQGYGTPAPEPVMRAEPASEPATSSVTPASSAPAGSTQVDFREPTGNVMTVERDAGLTDVGNSELLVGRHRHEYRYVPERGAWLRWAGTHWSWDDANRIVEAAKDTVLAITTDGDERLTKHRQRSLSRRSLEAMVALARSHPDVVALAGLLDADPYALCTPGGVVDLHTGQVHPAKPADLHTRCTSTPLRRQPTPRWDAFLADTFGHDLEMRDFVQRLAGYSTTGVVTHHVLPFLHGPGGNGKSVFLDVIRRLLGDYAATAPAGFLLAGQQAQHETEIARLAGLRFVICSEVNQEARFDEAKVKLLTGGDALTARFMRADHFTFTPSHHLWLMGNHQPRIGAGGDSFGRRLRLIGFTNVVPDDKKVDGLDRLLVDEEGPGILAWLIDGARLALTDGLHAPSSVLAATKAYMDEEDALARFVEDRIQIGGAPTVKTDTAKVRAAYTSWCSDQGERSVSPQVFGRELRTRYGIEQTRSHGKRFYLGVALLADPDDEPPPGEEPPHEDWWQQ